MIRLSYLVCYPFNETNLIFFAMGCLVMVMRRKRLLIPFLVQNSFYRATSMICLMYLSCQAHVKTVQYYTATFQLTKISNTTQIDQNVEKGLIKLWLGIFYVYLIPQTCKTLIALFQGAYNKVSLPKFYIAAK